MPPRVKRILLALLVPLGFPPGPRGQARLNQWTAFQRHVLPRVREAAKAAAAAKTAASTRQTPVELAVTLIGVAQHMPSAADGRAMNRGKCRNVAAHYAWGRARALGVAKKSNVFLVAHDVDLLPHDDMMAAYVEAALECTRTTPRAIHHFGAAWGRYTYPEYCGGVIGMTLAAMEDIGGYPNTLWGYGGEDDALGARIQATAQPYDLVQDRYSALRPHSGGGGGDGGRPSEPMYVDLEEKGEVPRAMECKELHVGWKREVLAIQAMPQARELDGLATAQWLPLRHVWCADEDVLLAIVALRVALSSTPPARLKTSPGNGMAVAATASKPRALQRRKHGSPSGDGKDSSAALPQAACCVALREGKDWVVSWKRHRALDGATLDKLASSGKLRYLHELCPFFDGGVFQSADFLDAAGRRALAQHLAAKPPSTPLSTSAVEASTTHLGTPRSQATGLLFSPRTPSTPVLDLSSPC